MFDCCLPGAIRESMSNTYQISVRFVGGPLDGEEMMIQRACKYWCPLEPSFPAGEACHITDALKRFVYDVHQMPFASGHLHYFAIPEGALLCCAINSLWQSYSRVGSLKSRDPIPQRPPSPDHALESLVSSL